MSVVAHVTVSLATLLGLDDEPGELAGHGAIPAAVARELSATATGWRRLLTDPADGHLVTQAIRSYRPSAAMRAFVLARADGTCASRGCNARHGLQIDHNDPYPRGPTAVTNHAPLHQPHHEGKTCGAWCHELDPGTGALTQTSPLGRSYTTTPLPPLGGALAGAPGRGHPPDPPGHHSVRPALIAELDAYLHSIDRPLSRYDDGDVGDEHRDVAASQDLGADGDGERAVGERAGAGTSSAAPSLGRSSLERRLVAAFTVDGT